MKTPRRVLFASCCVGWVAASAVQLAHAEGDSVVVTVGEVSVKQAELERRLASVPRFQLARYGDDDASIKRGFVDQVLVPEILYSTHADQEKLAGGPRARARLREARRQALVEGLRDEVEKQDPVTDAELQAYYDEHKDRFHTPERIQIWRILVKTEAEAKAVIAEATKAGDPKTWRKLARDKSIDKATAMRGGNLGFVLPDGQTNMPRVKVASALYTAAKEAKNGEILPKPVAEEKEWAVIWRRGSVAAVERTLESESRTIKKLLMQKKLDKKLEALLADLTKKHVTRNDDLLALIKLPEKPAGPRTRPQVVPKAPGSAATPRKSDRGLR